MALYEGDALEVLKTFEPDSIDCAICDLPYGSTQNAWDQPLPLSEMWAALRRVVKKAIVLTAIQPFSSELVCSNLAEFKHEWVWYKNKGSGHLNVKRAPLRYHEQVLVFSKNSFTYNPKMTEGHAPGNYAKRVKMSPCYGAQRSTEYGGATVRYPRSVQEFPILNNDSPERFHPTQKPVQLMRYLIETYSNPDDVVLDFAMGVGTTGVAARQLGRSFVGIEKDEIFFLIAQFRLAQTAA